MVNHDRENFVPHSEHALAAGKGASARTDMPAIERPEDPLPGLRARPLPKGEVTTAAVIVALLLTFARPITAQDDFAAELPRIPATEPADAIPTFNVADGFHIQQVAAEPLVNSPVAIEWDANGFLYVCEMRGYSEDKDEGISRISRLEDTDDDGVFDKSVVFVDGLLWPTAIFPFDGGLFVGDAPNLYYFKDDDGDGKADSKKVVFTGFGTSNVQGLFNSFRWGLDNRIHVATSSTGGMIQAQCR